MRRFICKIRLWIAAAIICVAIACGRPELLFAPLALNACCCDGGELSSASSQDSGSESSSSQAVCCRCDSNGAPRTLLLTLTGFVNGASCTQCTNINGTFAVPFSLDSSTPQANGTPECDTPGTTIDSTYCRWHRQITFTCGGIGEVTIAIYLWKNTSTGEYFIYVVVFTAQDPGSGNSFYTMFRNSLGVLGSEPDCYAIFNGVSVAFNCTQASAIGGIDCTVSSPTATINLP